MINRRFTRLIVIAADKPGFWKCRCDCGNISVVRKHGLTSSNTRSCGCLKKEAPIAAMTQAKWKHGQSVGKQNSPDYQKWLNMRRRCYDPTHQRYSYYGGRGIQICPEWRNDAKAFLDYMGPSN